MIVRSNHVDGAAMVIADVSSVRVPSHVDEHSEEIEIEKNNVIKTIRLNIGDHLRVIEGETLILHIERGKDSFTRIVGEG